MTVYQENSSVASNSANGPTTNKNSLETTVVADDGQIMVLGGQLQEKYSGNQSKVPLLGDLPFVGNLFKSQDRSRNKTILLVFLRPVVMRDAQASQSITIDRYEAIRAEQQANQPEPSRVLPINDSPVLPALPLKQGQQTQPGLPDQPSDKTPITVLPTPMKPTAP